MIKGVSRGPKGSQGVSKGVRKQEIRKNGEKIRGQVFWDTKKGSAIDPFCES